MSSSRKILVGLLLGLAAGLLPHPLDIRLPLAYPVARRDVAMARFLGLWIDIKKKDGTIQALYDHWILGRDAKAKAPRWSILRDVLHWDR